MAKFYTPIATTDTFQVWLDKTNALLTDLSTIIVTTDATAAGATTIGNVHLDGNLDANVLSVKELRGGTNTLADDLIISSDTRVAGDFLVTGTTNLSTTDITGALTVTSSATFSQTIIGDITGAANTANVLTTPRIINLIGSVTGTALFDGSADINILTESTGASAVEILTNILTVDGSGSGLDADLLDGLDSTAFVRVDQDATIDGDVQANTVSIPDGTGMWTVTTNSGNLLISFNGTKLFKLSSTGNLTVTGDITAFGTV